MDSGTVNCEIAASNRMPEMTTMKTILIFAAVVLFSTGIATAQQPPNFSGVWQLDVQESSLPVSLAITSMSMSVIQTPAEIRIERQSKQTGDLVPVSSKNMAVKLPLSIDGLFVFSLNGKSSKVDIDGPNGKIPEIFTALFKAKKLVLSRTISAAGPKGLLKSSIVETWEIESDSRTLIVNRDALNPRGTQRSRLVFRKS